MKTLQLSLERLAKEKSQLQKTPETTYEKLIKIEEDLNSTTKSHSKSEKSLKLHQESILKLSSEKTDLQKNLDNTTDQLSKLGKSSSNIEKAKFRESDE